MSEQEIPEQHSAGPQRPIYEIDELVRVITPDNSHQLLVPNTERGSEQVSWWHCDVL